MSTTLQERTDTVAFSNPWVTVDTVPARRADGLEYQHHRVSSGSGLGAVTIPIVNVRGLTYFGMVTQYRPVVGEESLEFPRGGTLDLGESEAIRELTEETGLIPGEGAVDLLGTIHPDTGLLTAKVAVYLARFSGKAFDITDGRVEHESGATVQWVTDGQFMGLVTTGRIRCGMTLATWGLAHARGALNMPSAR